MPNPVFLAHAHDQQDRTHLQARIHVDSGHLREQPDGGLLLDARRIDLGEDAIAMTLVADLAGVDGGRNTGQSATNAMDTVITLYQQVILDSLDVTEVMWIQLDSMGCIDHVIVPRRGALRLEWQPLLSGLHQGRTKEDFVALFGFAAIRALASVRTHARRR